MPAGVLLSPHQIPGGLRLDAQDRHVDDLALPQQSGQMHRVARVGLDPVAHWMLQLRRRRDRIPQARHPGDDLVRSRAHALLRGLSRPPINTAATVLRACLSNPTLVSSVITENPSSHTWLGWVWTVRRRGSALIVLISMLGAAPGQTAGNECGAVVSGGSGERA